MLFRDAHRAESVESSGDRQPTHTGRVTDSDATVTVTKTLPRSGVSGLRQDQDQDGPC